MSEGFNFDYEKWLKERGKNKHPDVIHFKKKRMKI